MNELEIFKRNKITIAVIDMEVPLAEFEIFRKYKEYAAEWVVEMSKQGQITFYNICPHGNERICTDIIFSNSLCAGKVGVADIPIKIDLDMFELHCSYEPYGDEMIFINDLGQLITYGGDVDKIFDRLEKISVSYNKHFVILANKTSYKKYLPTSNDVYDIKLIPYL